MNPYISRLPQSPLFEGISAEELSGLLGKIRYTIRSYGVRESVFAPHQEADTVAVLLDGFVTEQKISVAGNAVNITRHDCCDLVAHALVFLPEGECYTASYCACKGCVALLLHRSQLLRLFELAPHIQKNFLACISKDYATLDKKVELLSLTSIREKIAFYLLHEADRLDSSKIRLDFSKKMWAEFLNVPRTSLARELRNMKERGVISFSGRSLAILDAEYLHALLGKDDSRLRHLCGESA